MFKPDGVRVNGHPPEWHFEGTSPPASNILQFPPAGTEPAPGTSSAASSSPATESDSAPKPSFELRYTRAFFRDPNMRIGGLTGASEGGVMDRTFHCWTETAEGEAYWKIYTPDDRNRHALEWLRDHSPSKAAERFAKSASSTASLLASGDKTQWVKQSSGTVIGVRGAYLRIVRDGERVVLRAEEPSKEAGLTYIVPATFNWQLVEKDGTYVPRPVKPTGRFGQYLARFLPDLAVRALLQEAVGSTILNRAFEKCFWLQGEGSNGKSTLLHILRKLHPRNTALDLKQLGRPFALSRLVGTTLATVSECPDFLGPDVEQTLKAIVSRDPISTEEKWGGNLTVVPRASIFMLFNKAPRIVDRSYGFWSKVLAIPFMVQLLRDSGERIANFHELITEDPEEMAQVLDWVLEGAMRLEQRGNFAQDLPEAAVKLAERQRYEADNVLQYIDAANMERNENVRTLQPLIYADYTRFCQETGVKAIQANDFWSRLRDHFKPHDLSAGQAPRQQDGRRPRMVNLRVDGVPVYAGRAP